MPWPCDQCGAAGFRNVYARGYCVTHLADLYRSLRPDVWDLSGIGLPGASRPDHGPGLADLTCVACGATWVGPAFDPCGWCAQSLERLVEATRDALLRPPWLREDAGFYRYDDLDEVDKAVWDRTRGQVAGTDSEITWVRRLDNAVAAEIISEQEMDRALKKATREVHL